MIVALFWCGRLLSLANLAESSLLSCTDDQAALQCSQSLSDRRIAVGLELVG